MGFSGALLWLIVRNTGFVPKEELLQPLEFPERGAQGRLPVGPIAWGASPAVRGLGASESAPGLRGVQPAVL